MKQKIKLIFLVLSLLIGAAGVSFAQAATVVYYHDTTNGVAIGVDGPTNVVSAANVAIPPIITASMITANTCTGNARSQNHPTGLYTHSRWYLTTDYAVATNIGANPVGSAQLRGQTNTDTVTVSLYDYDPVSGAKTLIGSSAPITISGNTANYPYTISSPLYTVPAGHRLMLQYDFNQLASGDRARVYCSSTASYISVTEMPVAGPLADYRMDEAGWNGTPNEVADSSGNALHGTAMLGATTVAGKVCNAGSFAANYAEVADNTMLDITDNLTVSVWIKPNRCGGTPGNDALMSFYSKDTNYEAHVTNSCNINWWWGTGNITSAAAVPTGTWSHVAMVWKTGEQRLYINGVLSASGTVGGVLPTNASPFQIADDQNFGGGTRRFDGQIDELKIFNVAMSAAQVSAIHTNENIGKNWDGTARSCPSALHIAIDAPPEGMAFVAEPVVIAPHTPAHDPITGAGTVLLSTNTGLGDWTIGTGTGTLTPGAANSGQATYTFGVGESSATLGFTYQSAGTAILGVRDTTGVDLLLNTPAAEKANTIAFTVPSFVFTNGPCVNNVPFGIAGQTCTLATWTSQIAGLNSAAVYITAVNTSGIPTRLSRTRVRTRNMQFGLACLDPIANAGKQATFAGATLPLCQANGAAPTTWSAIVAVTFNAGAPSSNVPYIFNYADVGRAKLWMRNSGTTTQIGASSAFVVKPGGFVLSGIARSRDNYANPAAANAAGAAFVGAGEAFSVTVTATTCTPASAACTAAGATTPNYGREKTPESVMLTPNNVIAGMVGPAPAIGGTFGSFGVAHPSGTPMGVAGVAYGTGFTWGEVGIITLTPSVGDGSYLDAGDVIGTTSGNVGRFYPDHFDTAVVMSAAGVPMACPTNLPTGLSCPTSYNGIAYSGQPFSLTVAAKNAGGATTQNYSTTTGFARTVNLSPFGVLGTTTAPTGTGVLGVTSVSAFAAGALTETAEKYTFSTVPTTLTNIFIRASDGEASSLRATNPTTTSVEGGIAIVSGRIKVSNAYGSELLPLTLSATAQYYTATGWVNSITDSVTTLAVPGSYTVGTGSSATTLIPASGILARGLLNIRLGPPGGGATGVATVLPRVGGCTIAATCYLPVTPGAATFGVYKNNNNFIYRRESY